MGLDTLLDDAGAALILTLLLAWLVVKLMRFLNL